MNRLAVVTACAAALMPALGGCSRSPALSYNTASATEAPAAQPGEQRPSTNKSDQPALIVSNDIIAIQKALSSLGYSVGKFDGLMGPSTRAAIEMFQKDHGLPSDGHATLALLHLLSEQVGALPRSTVITVRAGDSVIYSDGSLDNSNQERAVSWDNDAQPSVVAIRPSTRGWPAAAKAGLDWAVSHALDDIGAGTVQWSSTGVNRKFEIRVYPDLTPGEANIAGPSFCRHFDLKDSSNSSRYPSIACKDPKGQWYFAHSQIRLARPASALTTSAKSDLKRR